MTTLEIQGKEDTPYILFDKASAIFEMSGRSLPEDAAEFYGPVLKWLKDYADSPHPATKFTIKMEYFNTASSKLLLDVLTTIELIAGASVIWYHYEDDEDMLEAGQEFAELVEVPFEFKSY
jgi:hypothetical protein